MLESLGETSGDYKSLSTNSKSGEFFFLSRDRKFLIKTVSEAEGRLLFRMLPEYQDHIHSSPMSLIVRFAGLYRVEIAKGSWKYFLLMMLFLHPWDPAVSFLPVFFCAPHYPILVCDVLCVGCQPRKSVFDPSCEIHAHYDLKGSLYHRKKKD